MIFSRLAVLTSLAFIFLYLAPTFAWTQSWATYEDSSKGISFQAPTNVVISRGSDFSTLFASVEGVSISVSKRKVNNPRKTVKNYKLVGRKGATGETYETDDFLVRRLNEYVNDEIYIALYVGLKKDYFTIAVSGQKDNPTMDRFLKTIRLGGVYLFPGGLPGHLGAGEPVIFDKLPISPEVEAALKRPNVTGLKPKFEILTSDWPGELHKFSRHLIVLSKPRPGYTDEARRMNIQGTIRANVEFLKNGNIGNITVDRSADYGLALNVVKAIRGIKFIPAQINGVPADVTRTIHYTFSIY